MSSIITIETGGILQIESGSVSVGSDPLFNSPNEVAGLSDWGWWDMSFAGVVAGEGGTWQDDAATTPCVNGSTMQRVDDLSGSGHHLRTGGASNQWISSALNGLGAGSFLNSSGLQTTGFVADGADEWTFAAIIRPHNLVGGQPEARSWASGGGTSHTAWGFNAGLTAGTKQYRIDAFGDTLFTDFLWVSATVDYLWFLFEFTQSSSNSYVDNVLQSGSGPAFADGNGPGMVEIGNFVATGGVTGPIIEAFIMDKVMTADERTGVFNYYEDRYDLSGQ